MILKPLANLVACPKIMDLDTPLFKYYDNGYMQDIVSITSQGQLTIPVSIRRSFGIKGAVKAIIRKEKNFIVVEPKKDFWSLEGSLASGVKLSDKELQEARESFSKNWPKV